MGRTEERIVQIRKLEGLILTDATKSNEILTIKNEFLTNKTMAIRTASMHILRRVFISLLDDGKMANSNLNKCKKHAVMKEYISWIQMQLQGYIDGLCTWIRSGDPEIQAPALRTLLEFVKREKRLQSALEPLSFGIKTFRRMLMNLLHASSNEVELLVMVRDEILEKPDCNYFAMLIIKEAFQDLKAQLASSTGSDGQVDRKAKVFIQNAFDLLRIIVIPESVDEDNFLVSNTANNIDDDDSGDELDDDTDSEEEDQTMGKKRKRTAKATSKVDVSKKRRLSLSEKLLDRLSHRRIFSKLWLLLLSVPLSATQHRLVLRHLPDHVIPEMVQPILLADYLTRSYNMGGVIAVLSLESLFILIAQHNLDYPNFFLSLYRLCTNRVFSAKYRVKFMRLLHMSLQSTNLPAYTVGAFIKRLMAVSLICPTPCAHYCIAQVTWLLRKHPQSQTLIHASTKKSSDDKSKNSFPMVEEFNNAEETDLEMAGALGTKSSLWEAALLQHHHLYSVASLAGDLRRSGSTASESLMGKPGLTDDDKPIPMFVPDYFNSSYAGIMDEEQDRARKGLGIALAVRKPTSLFRNEGGVGQTAKDTITKSLFGGY